MGTKTTVSMSTASAAQGVQKRAVIPLLNHLSNQLLVIFIMFPCFLLASSVMSWNVPGVGHVSLWLEFLLRSSNAWVLPFKWYVK